MTTKSIEYLELLKHVLSGSVYPESAWTVLAPKNKFKRWVLDKLASKNYIVVKRQPYSDEVRNEGLDWPMIGYSMIGHHRLDNIQACMEKIIFDNIPGDCIETGVWRGGAVILMRAVLKKFNVTDRTVWCADSFEGLPKPDVKMFGQLNAGADLSQRSLLCVSQEDVMANFKRFGLLDDQVRFLKGWFKDTLHTAPISQLALLRLDGDLYESTIQALNALYPKVSKGGFVVIDDYFSWESCKAAVDFYREQHHVMDKIHRIDRHAVYWRVGDVLEN